jgi:hypothetical protein
MMMVHKLILSGDAPPLKSCADAHPDEEWMCLLVIELQKFIKEPIFYAQSLYDGWSINNILGFKCAELFGSLSECEPWEREVIKEYHRNITEVVREVSKKEGNGAFAISCVAHDLLFGRWDNDLFEVPMNSSMMLTNATSLWLKRK